MAWKLYRWDDASAPSLTGAVGSLVTVWDKILVNGYGAKTAAGWTKAFTGTNKAAYRMGAGRLQGYVRLLDDGSDTGGAKEGMIKVFESMSDVDTGVDNIIGAAGNTYPIRKSDTADGVVRPWYAVADARTFIFATVPSFTSGNLQVSTTYVGEFYSYVPNDNFNLCVIARHTKNSATYNSGTEGFPLCNGHEVFGGDLGNYLARDSAGVAKARNFGKMHTFQRANSTMQGPFTFPNPSNGAAILCPIYIRDNETTVLETLRGRLRGVWASAHLHSNFGLSAGQTFDGTGDWLGKQFLAPWFCGEAAAGDWCWEVSDTVPNN